MVLRDEKERIRLARLSRSIRKETKCCIYRSKLQTFEGEPEIDDVDVYLGLTSCSRVEACGICLDSECLDRFEEYLTHDEQVEFKHCLISSDSRTFEKYQVEVAKMIREREDVVQRKIEKEIGESKRLEEKRRKKEEEEEALEYKPTKSLKKRLENIIDFTGDENDYVVFSDLYEHFKSSGSITPKKVVGDALEKMGIKKDLKRLNGKPRLIRLGIKLKDFENITEEYGDDTSAELSFASTDAETVSPMRRKSDVVEIEKLKVENEELKAENYTLRLDLSIYQEEAFKDADEIKNGPGPLTPNKMMLALDASLAEAENTKLIAENTALKEATAPAYNPEESELQELRYEITALKQALKRQNLEEEEVAEEEEEDPSLVPEVSKKKIDQLLSTTAKTMRSSTVQNVLKGLNAKVQEWEGDYINLLQDLTEADDKIKDYLTIIKQVERQTRTKVLDDYGGVLPDILKKAKDKALVDTPDTN
ncbi:unnamed protein product [Bathycoccus prasinos]